MRSYFEEGIRCDVARIDRFTGFLQSACLVCGFRAGDIAFLSLLHPRRLSGEDEAEAWKPFARKLCGTRRNREGTLRRGDRGRSAFSGGAIAGDNLLQFLADHIGT